MVKLTRSLMLIPIVLDLVILKTRREARASADVQKIRGGGWRHCS